MRKYLIAGNWKMNAGPAEGKQKAEELAKTWSGKNLTNEALICPPFVTISAVQSQFSSTSLLTGAQNVSDQDEGAYTGEVSINMLKDAGCSHVIVGHSERREMYGEDSALVAAKAKKVIDANLKAIVCVGEKLESRKANEQENVVRKQLDAVLETISAGDADKIVIAYEPVWAIGTGETATPDQAQSMHQFIRARVEEKWGKDAADSMQILYGGSMKPGNAEELLSQPDVDGGLIGGASLEPDSFSEIIEIAENLS